MSITQTSLRHEKSKDAFPFLKLDADEYVVLAISRSKFGLIGIWFSVIVMFLLLTIALILRDQGTKSQGPMNIIDTSGALGLLRPVVFVLYIFLVFFGILGTKVYLGNKMFITNKRVVQIAQDALFHKSTNIIELSRIEDVSFHRKGVLDYLFHMGTIRLSTVGDETTYTFHFVDTPTDEIETITRLVHEIKEKK